MSVLPVHGHSFMTSFLVPINYIQVHDVCTLWRSLIMEAVCKPAPPSIRPQEGSRNMAIRLDTILKLTVLLDSGEPTWICQQHGFALTPLRFA